MARKDTIEVEGTVADCLANATFDVTLPNGHRILAHLPRDVGPEGIHLLRGDKVMLEMTLRFVEGADH